MVGCRLRPDSRRRFQVSGFGSPEVSGFRLKSATHVPPPHTAFPVNTTSPLLKKKIPWCVLETRFSETCAFLPPLAQLVCQSYHHSHSRHSPSLPPSSSRRSGSNVHRRAASPPRRGREGAQARQRGDGHLNRSVWMRMEDRDGLWRL